MFIKGDDPGCMVTEGLSGCSDNQLPGDKPSPVRFLHPQHAAPRAHQYDDLLPRLVGYPLQSVQFIGGYVQFGFGSAELPDIPVLTCEVMPVVITPTGPIVDGQVGYADAIRRLIGHHVVDTAETPGKGIRIEFPERALQLRPTAAELTGPLIAMLSDFGDGRSMSWRPGGAAYEYLH